MTWTYGEAPGTSTADERRDAVRLLIGDTDTTDQQVQDSEISFALLETSDEIYGAAALMARTLASKFAREVDVTFDAVRDSNSQRADAYHKLAVRLDKKASTAGGGLGVPAAGGISIADIDGVEDNPDRPDPAFKRRQFANPPSSLNDDEEIRR